MRVSIVIPCHNVQEHLPKALDSAVAQDHSDTEIVCVDDGSTDGTPRVLTDYAARFPQKVRIISQANKGASAARNVGTAATSGDYLQFLDADDVILPHKISAQVALARFSGSPELIVGDFEQLMPNGLLLPALALHDRPWMALIQTRMGTTSANLWKRDALLAVGGWNEQLGSSQDYELMFRLLKYGVSIGWDPHIRTEVLKRVSGSISQTGVQSNWDRYITLRHAIMEHLRGTDPVRYAEEIETLRQFIFMALRIVAADDLPKALLAHKRSIGRGFRPQVGRAITERYAALYNLLGFATTERLMRLLKGRRPQHTIRSHADFLAFREADRIALRREFSSQMMFDEVWKFQRLLRRVEYCLNCHKAKGLLGKLVYKYWSIRFHRQSVRCGFDIPPNVFGSGLSIAHRGTIVVHPDARIGQNCRIHVDVVIGTRPGPKDLVPKLGDNCYIGPGAKLFGEIVIGPNCAIGANSVVNSSFPEGNMTIAGAPARKVSDTDSREYIIATRGHAKTLG